MYSAFFKYAWTWGWSIWKLGEQTMSYLHQNHSEGEGKSLEEDA